MKPMRILWLLALLTCCAPAWAQLEEDGEAKKVTLIKASIEPTKARGGEVVTLKLTFSVD